MENFIEETSSLKHSEKNRKKYFIYTLVSYASLVVAILSLFFAPIFIKVKNGKITIVASGAGLIVNIATLVLTFGLFLFLHFLFLKRKTKYSSNTTMFLRAKSSRCRQYTTRLNAVLSTKRT